MPPSTPLKKGAEEGFEPSDVEVAHQASGRPTLQNSMPFALRTRGKRQSRAREWATAAPIERVLIELKAGRL